MRQKRQARLIRNLWIVGVVVAAAAATGAVAFAAELAKVNDETITDKDLRLILNNFNEGQRRSILKDPQSRRQVLNTLIDQEILVSEASKEKLDQSAEYKDALEVFKKHWLSSKMLEKNIAPKITDQAVKRYFEEHKARYSTDQVHAMHILLSDEKTAQDVLKQASAPGADFQALAEKHSKDPSAKNNRGDLGFFGRDRMVPEFTESAFAGKPGELVGPVKTAYGYHVIKVVEKKMGKPMEFSEVELRVRTELQQELTRSYVGKLRAKAKVKVDDAALEKMM
ncbi:MAG: peptidylprolyl isomerase [Oligoflexia bacterium]|nr:peptidylprolyl isomerase [Oligoflexia bacterium]